MLSLLHYHFTLDFYSRSNPVPWMLVLFLGFFSRGENLAQGNVSMAFQAATKALSIRPCSATVGEELADRFCEPIPTSHKKQLNLYPESGLYNKQLKRFGHKDNKPAE